MRDKYTVGFEHGHSQVLAILDEQAAELKRNVPPTQPMTERLDELRVLRKRILRKAGEA